MPGQDASIRRWLFTDIIDKGCRSKRAVCFREAIVAAKAVLIRGVHRYGRVEGFQGAVRAEGGVCQKERQGRMKSKG